MSYYYKLFNVIYYFSILIFLLFIRRYFLLHATYFDSFNLSLNIYFNISLNIFFSQLFVCLFFSLFELFSFDINSWRVRNKRKVNYIYISDSKYGWLRLRQKTSEKIQSGKFELNISHKHLTIYEKYLRDSYCPQLSCCQVC